jgi:predicted nucleotidyltransferase
MGQSQVSKIVELICRECQPRRIILFGSQARGTAVSGSDIDIMVILDHITDRRSEMVKIRRLLLPLGVRVDVLVVTEKTFDEWYETPGNVYFEAAQEGRVLFNEEAA